MSFSGLNGDISSSFANLKALQYMYEWSSWFCFQFLVYLKQNTVTYCGSRLAGIFHTTTWQAQFLIPFRNYLHWQFCKSAKQPILKCSCFQRFFLMFSHLQKKWKGTKRSYASFCLTCIAFGVFQRFDRESAQRINSLWTSQKNPRRLPESKVYSLIFWLL